jgi:hypothetical protein
MLSSKKEAPMAKYLITYHGSGMPADPALMEQAKTAFMQWVVATGSAVLDPGAPVHLVGQVAQGAPGDAVEIGGYSIIEAPTLEAAQAILQGHPFVGRGGTLQINEVMGV